MYSFIARQPILNTQKKVIAYELLFRDSAENIFPDIDSDDATKKLVSDNVLNVGFDKIADEKTCYINFSKQAILQQLPRLLSKNNLVIELLEDIEPCESLLEEVIALHRLGYQLALDDFHYHTQWLPYLPYISIIKFDIRLSSFEEIRKVIAFTRQYDIKYLAEKVETLDEFEQAKTLGVEMFQGYFFSRPEIFKQKALAPSQLVVLELLNEIAKPDLNFNRIEGIFVRDVTLSYKLLMFVNKQIKSNAKPIASFKQAAVYLGEQQLKKFISLVATSLSKQDKPSELYLMSVIRARFCERVFTEVNPNDAQQAFLTGLFSLLDSLLDQPLTALLAEVQLNAAITQALTERQGPLGHCLNCIEHFEHGRWQQISESGQLIGLKQEQLAQIYLESLSWAKTFHISE
ncbi:EAL and HDOD domain-containing protein [Motilimonas eburnea]|uniref:EAL and HDOD domain-containing protein n=1 Tax=Motilimonas eburnea TaxID=1737488 RepID=UPI001E37E46F|nr:EAL domain-containing protein [Motilimonas eburnea]MCE2572550.1 EAL domain-containing protein [Motilimonas eburnea]